MTMEMHKENSKIESGEEQGAFLTLAHVLAGKRDFNDLSPEIQKDVFAIAQNHFLSGLLYRLCPPANPEIYGAAEREWTTQSVQNLVLLQALQEFETECRNSGLHPVRLKGASLIPRIYPDLGSRHLSDVDLLFDEAELLKAQEILIKRDYQADPVLDFVGSRNRQAWVMSHPSGIEIGMDLHTRINWRPTTGLLLRIVEDPGGFLRLDDKTEFLHLILNWIEQDTCVSFNKMMDIYFYFCSTAQIENWPAWLEEMRGYGFGRSTRLAFIILQEVFGSAETVTPDSKSELWARELIRTGWLQDPQRDALKYFGFKHLTKPLVQSLIYDLDWTWANLKRRIGFW